MNLAEVDVWIACVPQVGQCTGGGDGSAAFVSIARTQDIAQAAAAFAATRPRLVDIAYGLVRNTSDAEDVVQDVWIRWQRCDRSAIRDSQAFLTKVTKHLALNLVTSARARRERFIDPRLSESLANTVVPEFDVETSEAVRRAIGVLMTRLSSTECAVYVLREAFSYPYERIGGILGQSPSSIRQLMSRARKRVAAIDHDGWTAESPEAQRVFQAFVRAGRSGDLSELEGVSIS